MDHGGHSIIVYDDSVMIQIERSEGRTYWSSTPPSYSITYAPDPTLTDPSMPHAISLTPYPFLHRSLPRCSCALPLLSHLLVETDTTRYSCTPLRCRPAPLIDAPSLLSSSTTSIRPRSHSLSGDEDNDGGFDKVGRFSLDLSHSSSPPPPPPSPPPHPLDLSLLLFWIWGTQRWLGERSKWLEGGE